MAAYTLYKESGEVAKANNFLISAIGSPDLDGEVKAKTYKSMLAEMQTSQRDGLLDQMESLMLELNANDPMVLEVIGDRKKNYRRYTGCHGLLQEVSSEST